MITYSSLISACEKAGRWETALQLFDEMQRDACTPNTVTYNSLITACGQGESAEGLGWGWQLCVVAVLTSRSYSRVDRTWKQLRDGANMEQHPVVVKRCLRPCSSSCHNHKTALLAVS